MHDALWVIVLKARSAQCMIEKASLLDTFPGKWVCSLRKKNKQIHPERNLGNEVTVHTAKRQAQVLRVFLSRFACGYTLA